MLDMAAPGEFTTQVWERVCVCCGSPHVKRMGGRLACARCHRWILRMRTSDDSGGSMDMQLLAQTAMREITREEVA